MPICYVSACEDLVDALFCFLCYCFGDNAGCDDFVKDLAALFLAEQLYGVLEKLGGKLLDNGGGIGIVEQLLDSKIPEIHDNTPFRYCGGVVPRILTLYRLSRKMATGIHLSVLLGTSSTMSDIGKDAHGWM